MQTHEHPAALLPQAVTVLCAILLSAVAAVGQGTVTFNGAAGLSSTYYEESGLWFQLVIPAGTTGRDDMAIIAGGGNTPYNGTPFMGWFRQYNPSDYVSLSLTNGSPLGLTAVDLADPTSPSPSPVPVSFIGYLAGGATVTNTFTTPGNGATTFAGYSFDSTFASGLTRVDILAPRWAMDNLVFTVPEPSALALISVVALTVAARNARRRRGL